VKAKLLIDKITPDFLYDVKSIDKENGTVTLAWTTRDYNETTVSITDVEIKVPELKCKIETMTVVDMFDLEEFIKEVTGQTYDASDNEEYRNDTDYRYTVFPFNEMYGEHDKKAWESFKLGGYTPGIRAILNGLCSDGHLKEGLYLISVCW